MFSSYTLAALFVLEFYSVFYGDPNKCPIEFNNDKCIVESFGCDWHGYYSPKENKIVLNLNHWQVIPDVHKKELVFHELGHCALNMRHRTDIDIMRQRVYATKIDGSNWEYLVNKMKKRYYEQNSRIR